jgi:hypothetical protein
MLYAPYTHSVCSFIISPKHLGHGIASGVSNVVAGAVGAVGLVVLFPVSEVKLSKTFFIHGHLLIRASYFL